jgi:hypothetical protein
MDTGHHLGWSGEDIYTALAYYALIEYEKMSDLVLEQAMLSPSPRIIPSVA